MDRGAPARPQLDDWLAHPAMCVAHRRESTASADQLWQAAREVALSETPRLGRMIRWRIPGLDAEVTYDGMFREPPFVVLEHGERLLVSGLVGRIWTLRRDYPELRSAQEFRSWSQRGTAQVVFANWTQDAPGGGATLHSETRVGALGMQGRVGVAAVRPLARTFGYLVSSEGIDAAVRRAEH